jgi:hypothetical protein
MKIPVTLLLLALVLNGSAQRLIPLIDADYNLPLDVLDGEIQAMTTWNGNLIAAGKIESVNGIACNQIFQWDGTHYSTLGNGWAEGGSSQNIQCLVVYNDLLLAAGRLDAGGGNEYVIQSFDGTTWGNYTPYDFDARFTDMIVFDDMLIVSGEFSDQFQYVAAYNGTDWLNLGSAFNDGVLDLEIFNGELYACGDFTFNSTETTTLNHIAKWNGAEWEALEEGVNNAAFSMTVFEDELVLGGAFDGITNGEQTGHLCKWNGNALMSFEQTSENNVYELFQLDGEFGFAEHIEMDLIHLHVGENSIRYRGMFGPVVYRTPTVFVHNEELFVGVEEHSSLLEYSGEFNNLMSGLMYLETGSDEVFLEVNNAKVPVTPFPTFFTDPLLYRARFEVPAGGGVSPIFAAALWASGINSQGDSLVAATMFSNEAFGWSFGPVGDELTNDYLKKYHRVWKLSAQEIEEHQNSFGNGDYTMPESILNWPCNGNILNGESHHLASFEDLNENGWYEPTLGEYPIIPGDECAYIILNDRFLQENYPSTFTSMNLEAHIMFYGYANQPEPIASAVFVKTKMFNRSTENYSDFRISSWSDFDLGSGFDDYVGSDSLAMISYCYNGDSFDEPSSSSPGYGTMPPAFGNVFLSQDMAASTYYNLGSNPINGDPILPNHYFNYARGRNKIGGFLQYNCGTPSSFSYSGDVCTGVGDTEANCGNPPSDRRIVASSNSTTLLAGQSTCFEMAYVYFRNEEFDNLQNACALIDEVPAVRSFYENDVPVCSAVEFPAHVPGVKNEIQFTMYPNPAQFVITLVTSDRDIESIVMYDAIGKVVVTHNVVNSTGIHNLSVEELPQGVYLIQLNSPTNTGVMSFIKN